MVIVLPLAGWFGKTIVDHFLQGARVDRQAEHQRKLADREAENRSHFENRVPVLQALSTHVERLVEATNTNVSLAQGTSSDDRKAVTDPLNEAMRALWDYRRDNKVHIPDDVLEKVEDLLKMAWTSALEFFSLVVDRDAPKNRTNEWTRINKETVNAGKELSSEIRKLIQAHIEHAP